MLAMQQLVVWRDHSIQRRHCCLVVLVRPAHHRVDGQRFDCDLMASSTLPGSEMLGRLNQHLVVAQSILLDRWLGHAKGGKRGADGLDGVLQRRRSRLRIAPASCELLASVGVRHQVVRIGVVVAVHHRARVARFATAMPLTVIVSGWAGSSLCTVSPVTPAFSRSSCRRCTSRSVGVADCLFHMDHQDSGASRPSGRAEVDVIGQRLASAQPGSIHGGCPKSHSRTLQ